MAPSAADAREVTRVAPCSPMELRALMARGAPFVVSAGMLDSWAARSWTLKTLAERFSGASVCVRLHPRDAGPVWEGECLHVGVTLGDFCAWLSGASSCARLAAFPRAAYVGYADYQDMVRLFANAPGALAEVDWASLGVARDGAHPGAHSTLWLGSAGAHTPCHYDTYGSNLVAQLQGTKRWRLHPPTAALVPSRVPYEESSVFTSAPDAGSLHLEGSLELELRAGELLFVPKHWWHQVSTTSDHALSVNTWIDSDDDDDDRASEALVRTVVCRIMGGARAAGAGEGSACATGPAWLNPTEEMWSAEEDLAALGAALAKGAPPCVVTMGDVANALCTGRVVQEAVAALRRRVHAAAPLGHARQSSAEGATCSAVAESSGDTGDATTSGRKRLRAE